MYSGTTKKCVIGKLHDTYLRKLPRDLADLKARITAAVKNIAAPMLTRVWQVLQHRIDVCRVTRGAHIEHL
jgi:hypothetical protein